MLDDAAVTLRDLALRSGGPDNVTIVLAEVMKRLIGAGGVKVPLRETYAITLASNAWSTVRREPR